MSASKHHLIHSTSKQQEQIGDFHLTSITPRGSDRTGWHQKHVGAAFPSRCDLSILFNAIRLCQVSWVLNGHEDVLVVVGWCVDSLLDLLSDLNMYSDPESLHPPVNVVTSLCRECEYQRLSFCPFPSPEFRFSFGGFDCHSPSWDCWRIMHTSIWSFHVLFGDIFLNHSGEELSIHIIFVHYLWKVLRTFDFMKLSKWNNVYWIPYIHNKYINDLCIVRLIALWVIVLSAWNSSGCSVIINGGCPHVDMGLTVCECACVWMTGVHNVCVQVFV